LVKLFESYDDARSCEHQIISFLLQQWLNERASLLRLRTLPVMLKCSFNNARLYCYVIFYGPFILPCCLANE